MSPDLYNVVRSFWSPSGPLQVAVGVSGGVDSIVLLDIMHHIAPSLKMDLTVVHVHHGLRGSEADGDAEFVRSMCAERNIECVVERVDVVRYADEHRCGIEAAARALRYEVFERIATERGAPFIVVGHTADDVAETMLMHLARGSGVEGLSAHRQTRPLTENITIVRPLLGVQRSDILEHARMHGLSWREDTSNTDPSFLRNMVRNEIMPSMRSTFGKDVALRMALSSDLMHDASCMIHDVVEEHLASFATFDEITSIIVEGLAALPQYYHRHIIREFLTRGMGQPPSYTDVQRVLDLMHAETGSYASLSGNYTALRERSSINVAPGTQHLAPKVYVAGSQQLSVRSVGIEDVEITDDPQVAYLDADRVNGPLVWRTWEDGDRFIPFGMNGSVLVSDLLTNAKVPFSTRRSHHVVADDDGILWLCGIRPAERTRITSVTTNVLILSTTDH